MFRFAYRKGLILLAVLSLGACPSSDGDGDAPAADAGTLGGGDSAVTPPLVVPAKLAIVADWLHGSLSYVDMAAVVAGGASRTAVVTGTVALTAYPPGPLELELTPDRKTALVSSSVGFFSIPLAGVLVDATDIPTDPGKLLFVDVATGKVTGDLVTGQSPMGIAFTPDGKRAFVAHFTSGDLAVVDVEKKALVERIPLGVYPEEIAIDDSGTVGVIGYSSTGSVLTFAVSDVRASLTPVELVGDSAGLAFFPGTKVAFVVQAPNPLSPSAGYTVLDVSDPKAPKVLSDERLSEAPVAYPAVPAKNRGSVLLPATVAGRLVVREYKLEGGSVRLTSTIDIADASLLAGLGTAYDEDHTLLIAWAAQRSLVAVDLTAGTSRIIPWLAGAAGPADIVVR